MPSVRRSSMAAFNPPAPTSNSTRSSRRASIAPFAAPSESKVTKKIAPAKPKRASISAPKAARNVTKKDTLVKNQEESSFVAGDLFNFSEVESPKGPMTRARRSSIYVAPGKNILPITSTKLRSVTKKSRRVLEAVLETPIAAEASFMPKGSDIGSNQLSPEGEVSFKDQILNKSSSVMKESKVVISPIKKADLKQLQTRPR